MSKQSHKRSQLSHKWVVQDVNSLRRRKYNSPQLLFLWKTKATLQTYSCTTPTTQQRSIIYSSTITVIVMHLKKLKYSSCHWSKIRSHGDHLSFQHSTHKSLLQAVTLYVLPLTSYISALPEVCVAALFLHSVERPHTIRFQVHGL